jgi:hypothetical protein
LIAFWRSSGDVSTHEDSGDRRIPN